MLVISLAAGGCCPEVRKLDGGIPAVGEGGSSGGAVTLSAIQTNILDRHCVTGCHDLYQASAGLRLNRGRTHAALVHQPSQQIKSALLVLPGAPDKSYLIMKMEGTTGVVGDRMPRLATPRPAAEVALLRAWISNGAPND